MRANDANSLLEGISVEAAIEAICIEVESRDVDAIGVEDRVRWVEGIFLCPNEEKKAHQEQRFVAVCNSIRW